MVCVLRQTAAVANTFAQKPSLLMLHPNLSLGLTYQGSHGSQNIHTPRVCVCVCVCVCKRERVGKRGGKGLSSIGVNFSCLVWFCWWNDEHCILLMRTEQTKLIGRRSGKLQLTATASCQSGGWGGAITIGSAKRLKGHMNRQKLWWINGWQLSSALSSHKQAPTEQTCPQQFTLG